MNTCRVCFSSGPHSRYLAREMMLGLREEFNYFQCSECGCLQIETVPKDIGKYYPTNYYSFSQSPDDRFKPSLKNYLMGKRDSFAITGSGLMGRLLHYKNPATSFIQLIGKTGIRKSSRILDVGSGDGTRIFFLWNAGFRNLQGIDPFLREDLIYKNGPSIQKKAIEDVQGAWDLIMFNHVFEHVSDPLEVLKQVHRLLDRNGVCLIRIPTVSSYAWDHYKTDWIQLDAPRHFFLHSIESLDILAKKTGFRVREIKYDSSAFQFMGSELYKRDVSMKEGDFRTSGDNRFFSEEELEEFALKAQEMNDRGQGDQAAFYLEKIA